MSGEPVTPEIALKVAPINAGLTFIADQVASLPLHLYTTKPEGRVKAEGDPLYRILHDVVNLDKLTSYQWRKQSVSNLKLYGRDYTFIERNKAGRVMNLWPLNPDPNVTRCVVGADGRKHYEEKRGSRTIRYDAADIIDLFDKLKPNGIDHYSPVELYKDVIGLARSVDRYASGAFAANGVPPMQLVCTLPDVSPEAFTRGVQMIAEAFRQGMAEGKKFIPLPPGYELKPIAADIEKMQMITVRSGLIITFAQMLNLPPVFLQDLSKGTYANTEQQGTMLVKNSVAPLTTMMQQEFNAKLVKNWNSTIEFNLDGLLRGDFKTRMDGYAVAIQNGIRTPDEVRSMENLAPVAGGDRAFINSASVPLESAGSAAPGDMINDETPPEEAGGEEE